MPADAVSAETFALILGASEFPRATAVFPPNPAFQRAAAAFHAYLMAPPPDGLGLRTENVLCLFDREDNPASQADQIAEFLNGMPATTNLVVYYVGHGLFDGDEYYIALRNTDPQRVPSTALALTQLGSEIKRCADHWRTWALFDCCFAATIADAWQADTVAPALVRRAEGAIAIPRKGMALLAASSRHDVAYAPKDAEYPRFSEALLKILSTGSVYAGDRLSLEEVHQAIVEYLTQRYRGTSRPEVHAPDQRDGNLAKVPFFPNAVPPAGRVARSEGGGRPAIEDPPRRSPLVIIEVAVLVVAAMVIIMLVIPKGGGTTNGRASPDASVTSLECTSDQKWRVRSAGRYRVTLASLARGGMSDVSLCTEGEPGKPACWQHLLEDDVGDHWNTVMPGNITTLSVWAKQGPNAAGAMTSACVAGSRQNAATFTWDDGFSATFQVIPEECADCSAWNGSSCQPAETCPVGSERRQDCLCHDRCEGLMKNCKEFDACMQETHREGDACNGRKNHSQAAKCWKDAPACGTGGEVADANPPPAVKTHATAADADIKPAKDADPDIARIEAQLIMPVGNCQRAAFRRESLGEKSVFKVHCVCADSSLTAELEVGSYKASELPSMETVKRRIAKVAEQCTH